MNNKVVAMKENKLGLIGWLTSLEFQNKHFLTYLLLDKINFAKHIIPILTKEQIIALLKKTNGMYHSEIFTLLNEKLKGDKTLVLAFLTYAHNNNTRFHIMNIAKCDAWKDKDLVISVLNKAWGIKEIVNIMERTKFDAWNDAEVVIAAAKRDIRALNSSSNSLKNNKTFILTALNIFSALDTPEILSITSSDLKNDRDVVLAAVSKNGLALKFASEHLKKDNYIATIASLTSNKDQCISAFLSLSKTLQEDKHIIDTFFKSLYDYLLNTTITKIIHTATNKTERTTEGYYSGGYDGGANGPWEASEWIPGTNYTETTTTTTYGFDEAKTDELLKGLPQEIIDEVKAKLANKTRTETT